MPRTRSRDPRIHTDGPPGPCLEWAGARTKAGYGSRWRNGRVGYVHRQTWEDAHGAIPAGMVIRHLCHNPACYRLEHLALGTQADNERDKVAAGRYRNGGTLTEACPSGHAYDDANTRRYRGRRHCRACDRIRAAARRARA